MKKEYVVMQGGDCGEVIYLTIPKELIKVSNEEIQSLYDMIDVYGTFDCPSGNFYIEEFSEGDTIKANVIEGHITNSLWTRYESKAKEKAILNYLQNKPMISMNSKRGDWKYKLSKLYEIEDDKLVNGERFFTITDDAGNLFDISAMHVFNGGNNMLESMLTFIS